LQETRALAADVSIALRVDSAWSRSRSSEVDRLVVNTSRRELLGAVGLSLEDGPLVAAGAEQVRELGAHQLVVAASAALAADPLLRGRSRPVVRARQAVARLGAWANIAPRELGWALNLPTPSLRRVRSAPADSRSDRAVLVRLTLLIRVARSPNALQGVEG